MAVSQDVVVIIETNGDQSVRNALYGAIASSKAQAGVNVSIIVLFCSEHPCRDLYHELEDANDTAVFMTAQLCKSKRISLALENIASPYFTFLSDTSILLPGTLASKIAIMQTSPQIDIVVSSKRQLSSLEDDFCVNSPLSKSPLSMLIEQSEQVITSSNALYRSRTISSDYFVSNLGRFYWEFISVKLLMEKKVSIVDVADHIEGQLSYSCADARINAFCELDYLTQVKTLPLSRTYMQTIDKRVTGVWHELAKFNLLHNNKREAWRYHLSSMRTRQGAWAYWRFTFAFIKLRPRLCRPKVVMTDMLGHKIH